MQVIRVERDGRKVRRVVITSGVFSVSFVKIKGKVVKEVVRREDGARLYSSEQLYMPQADYAAALKKAHAIFSSSAP